MKGQFVLSWPDRLSLWDLNRLVRAKRTCSIPDELGRLAGKGVQMSSEEAYALITQIEDLADVLKFYPLDASREPEEWEGREADLPTCVLATTAAQYVDVNDMARIVALDEGRNIPDYVPEQERQARKRRQRNRLVLTTQCREEGCGEEIRVTVGMAARAIREHRLIEKGDSYEPPTLCKKHRLDRDVRLADKRRNAPGLATIGEHVSARDAAGKSKPKTKKPARSKRDKPAIEPVNPPQEVEGADSNAVAVAPLTEPETPQMATPEPELGPTAAA